MEDTGKQDIIQGSLYSTMEMIDIEPDRALFRGKYWDQRNVHVWVKIRWEDGEPVVDGINAHHGRDHFRPLYKGERVDLVVDVAYHIELGDQIILETKDTKGQ